MIKCIYDECQWPECEKTCGMVLTGDYAIGSSAEEKLILYLQDRITKLLEERKEYRAFYSNQVQELVKGTKWLENHYDENQACAKVCLYGHTDCVNNPEYLRRYHPEWWKELGMPTKCTKEECYYDDEDK